MFDRKLTQRYRRNSVELQNSKINAIDELKLAFESAENSCSGVSDFFVKEIVSSLNGRQALQSQQQQQQHHHHHHQQHHQHHHQRNNINPKYEHSNAFRVNANFS